MTAESSIYASSRREHYLLLVLLGLALLVGVLLRARDVGARSLWADEFCTWHVSRMPFRESIVWGPELTKPPLYQLLLRLVTTEAKPSEQMLRLPALVAGILCILTAFQLAVRTVNARVAVAIAGLFAVNVFQIQHSQEARPYSLFVLGSIVTSSLWYELIVRPRWWKSALYVLAAVISLHNHYLIVLTFAGQWTWSFVRAIQGHRRTFLRHALPSMVAVVALCTPIIVHYLRHRTSTFQGLDWIAPPTWRSTLDALGTITFGTWWVAALLAPAGVVWLVATVRRTRRAQPNRWSERIAPDEYDVCSLLWWWFGFAWGGLLMISWIAHPAMVGRYAIAAALPAMLIPLVIAERIHTRLLPAVATVFVAIGLRQSYVLAATPAPGFREMSSYLASVVTDRDLIVLAIDYRTHPDWDDAERLCFQYYTVPGHEIAELRMAHGGLRVENDVLSDPRAMYLVVLWIDPLPILEAAGRTPEPFVVDGRPFTQLLFSPYRLVKIKPLANGA